MKVDVIILSKCQSEGDLAININCIESLSLSEPNICFNIIIIESNREFYSLNFFYQSPVVTVVIPEEPFNYNKFLNIGLDLATEQWVIFSNNDVIFHKNWLSNMFKVREENNKIQSFCPFDPTSPYLSLELFSNKPYHLGYRVPIEFVGWCFVVERAVFKKTGKFDEQFDFYFQDNDFALTLKKYSIIHVMVSSSFVEHIGGYTTNVYDASKTEKYKEDKIKFQKKWKQSLPGRLKTKLLSLWKK